MPSRARAPSFLLLPELAPAGEFHLFEGMGHGSIYGHAHDVLNPFIEEIVRRYL